LARSYDDVDEIERIEILNHILHPGVMEVYNGYPQKWREKTLHIRQLVLDVATELKEVATLEETLKWGEPSYLTGTGSTIRIAWLRSKPEQYGIYFNCRTKLVDTFQELFGDTLVYEGNRAIIFKYDDLIPEKELRECVKLSLTYHLRKNNWMLGA